MATMQYRRLGRAGIKVSVLSFGSWVTFHEQIALDRALECMQAAYDGGVNFFDNAESYAQGESERIMGQALRELGWPRHTYLVSSKFYWGIHDGVNTRHTLNRKYLLDAIDGSLDRMGLDYLDLVFCHRPDPDTPIEETVRALSDAIDRGKALYWGTSEWSADEIRTAWHIADRYGWHKPVMEQPQYSLLSRKRVEQQYARLFEDIGLGTTVWSPLAGGLLTGKYLDGIPQGSRASMPQYDWVRRRAENPDIVAKVRAFKDIAEGLDVTMAQLALAWCVTNPNVSTVITGATRVEQVHDNLGALDALERITDDVASRLDELFPIER